MVRLLPDTDLLVSTLLRDALGFGLGIYTQIPDDQAGLVPFVIAFRVPSGGAVHPRFLDQALVNVEAWHSSKETASDLAEEARAALYLAWENQTPTVHGSLAYYDEQAGPAELSTEGQPAGIYRYQATYVLTIRPVL